MKKADNFQDPMAWNTTGYGFCEWTGEVFHPGIDLNWNWGDQDLGRAIVVCANGLVEYAGYDVSSSNKGWGNHIIIKHELPDGQILFSHYAHLKDMLVNKGDEVGIGMQIGTCGKTGGWDWAHLHFEIRKPIGKGYNFWPAGWTEEQVRNYYLDPIEFITTFKPVSNDFVLTQGGMEVRKYENDPEDIISDLKKSLETTNDMLANKTLEVNALRGELEKQEADNTDLLGQLGEARKARDLANLEIEKFKLSNQSLAEEIEKTRKEVKMLGEEIDGLRRALSEATGKAVEKISSFQLLKEILRRFALRKERR